MIYGVPLARWSGCQGDIAVILLIQGKHIWLTSIDIIGDEARMLRDYARRCSL